MLIATLRGEGVHGGCLLFKALPDTEDCTFERLRTALSETYGIDMSTTAHKNHGILEYWTSREDVTVYMEEVDELKI